MKLIHEIILLIVCMVMSSSLSANTQENFCIKYFSLRAFFNVDLKNCDLDDASLETLIPKILQLKTSITQEINFTNNRITDKGVAKLVAGFSKMPTWDNIWLNLGKNPITMEAIKSIAGNQQIKQIVLSDTHLTDEAANILANSSIDKMYLNNTHVSQLAAKLLTSKPNLKEFSLMQNDSVMNHEVIASLAKQNKLRLLAFSNSTLSVEDVKVILSLPSLKELELTHVKLLPGTLELLSSSKTVRWLTLNGMQITDKDAVILSQSKYIHQMNLQNNKIHRSGVTILAMNPGLYQLTLDNNPIGDAGVLALARSPFLYSLSVAGTGLTTNGAIALIKSLQSNIRTLNLSHNPIGDGALPYLLNTFYDNCAHSLRLDYTLISDKGLQQLKPAKNSGCGWVSLAGNHIGLAGAKGLRNFFGKNKNAVSINLNDNNLGDAGLATLADVGYTNIKLEDNNFSKKAFESFLAKIKFPSAQITITWNEKTFANP